MKKIIIISLFLFIMPSCKKIKEKKSKKPKSRYTQYHPTKQNFIKRKSEKQFTIALPANPTTGYTWKFAQSIDPDHLYLVDSEYIKPETKRMGVGGIHVWKFKTLNPGRTEIKLIYIRPWQKNVPPARQRLFTIDITS